MSAALWAEREASEEAHPGLGPTTMRPDQLAGRVALPVPRKQPERRRVRLEVWGATEKDADDAERLVRWHPAYHGWQVVSTERQISPVSTIKHGDRLVVAHDAYYGWAWAVYDAPAEAAERTDG
jgi:hypothetical protein